MAKNQVVILHGWSDSSKSFRPLAEFLQAHGYQVVPLWLGDYRSRDDDVRIEDVGKRMEAVLRAQLAAGSLTAPFDLIVHSTGGLVAREWISAYYGNDIAACPAKRLVMLAPANFGSRLASIGQSALGRLTKGWNNWFHTGKEILRELELGSSYQWQLAQRDLFLPPGVAAAPPLYGATGVWPFVVTGTHPYTDKLRQIVNENGSDGTVRVAAANLNTRGLTVDFAASEADPVLTPWRLRHGETQFPLAVLPDRTHSSILRPEQPDVPSAPHHAQRLGELILAALRCSDFAVYQSLVADWHALSERTTQLAQDTAAGTSARAEVFGPRHKPKVEYFHQYLQVNVRVVDDHGAEVADYFLEFSGPDEERGSASTVFFHSEVLEHVHPFGPNPCQRCLYVDRTDLVERYYASIPGAVAKVLNMSVSAAPPGEHVSYFANYRAGARGTVPLHVEDPAADGPRWLQRNSTHFVEVIIPRAPRDDVFRLTRF